MIGDSLESVTADSCYINILKTIDSAIQDINGLDNSGETESILNTCIANIVEFINQVTNEQSIYCIPTDLGILGLKLSFIAIEKAVAKATLEGTTRMVENICKKSFELPEHS